jgi:hypothetical protein
VCAYFIWYRLRLMRNLVCDPSRYFSHKSTGEKTPASAFQPGSWTGRWALGDIEDARDCPEKTPMLLGLAKAACGVCAKLNTPGRSKMARNAARRRDAYFLSLGQRVEKSCCRVAAGCDGSRSILRPRKLPRMTNERRPDA